MAGRPGGRPSSVWESVDVGVTNDRSGEVDEQELVGLVEVLGGADGEEKGICVLAVSERARAQPRAVELASELRVHSNAGGRKFAKTRSILLDLACQSIVAPWWSMSEQGLIQELSSCLPFADQTLTHTPSLPQELTTTQP